MTRISFINEIANVCEATGADVVRVAEGVGLDRRIGSSFLRAGIGYGGSCFPKDSLALKQLAANSGYHFQLLNAVIEVNELQKRRVIGKLQQHLGTLRGQDGRAARARVQAEHRRHSRGAEPRPRGPARRRGRGRSRLGSRSPTERGAAAATICADPLEALAGADAAVLVTEWPQLADLDWAEAARRRMRNPLLVDGRNMLDPTGCATPASSYESIGRAPAEREPLRRHPRRRPRHAAAAADRQDAQGHAAARRPAAARLHLRAPAPARRQQGDRLVRLPADADPGATSATATAISQLEYRVEEEPLGTGGAIRFAADGIDEPFLALNGDSLRETDLDALVAFHRERQCARDDPAHARRGSEPLRARARARRRRARAELPREAAPGGDRHEPDQRGPLRARAGRARPDPAGPACVDRARGLPAPRRRAGGLRRRARRLLARRRHARRLPAGPPRRARAELRHRARRRARPRLHARRPDGAGQRRRAARAAGLRRRGRDGSAPARASAASP